MLNKEICKKCRYEIDRWWNEYDDNRWNNGKLYCIPDGRSYLQIDCDPPNDCKYQLEHIVSKKEK